MYQKSNFKIEFIVISFTEKIIILSTKPSLSLVIRQWMTSFAEENTLFRSAVELQINLRFSGLADIS